MYLLFNHGERKMLAFIWIIIVAILDWRTSLRVISRKPSIDVVFVSNVRDSIDYKRVIGRLFKNSSFISMNRFWLEKRIAGRLLAIVTTTEELLTSSGRRKAREQFLIAVRWAQKRGVKVVLFAAGTKRLFNSDELKKLFPDIIFSIGDNGTSQLLIQDTLNYLNKYNLKPNNSRIAVLAPYGFLGEEVTNALTGLGYNVIGAGPNVSGIRRVKEQYKIDVCETFEEMGYVDAVVACTHSEKIRLNAEYSNLIRKTNKKLLVLDVAEPANLTEAEHKKCNDSVIRIDVGNGYCKNLSTVFGAVSWKIIRLGKGGL